MNAPPPPAASAPAPVAAASPAPPPPAKPADEHLTIGFDEGSKVLNAAALAELDHAARLYRDANPDVMIVAGHTDKTGGEYANLILSAQRAASVKQALVERGVPADRLQIIAIGEAEPAPDMAPSRSAIVTWR